VAHVEQAVRAARAAAAGWARTPQEQRFAILRKFAAICKSREADLTQLISDETGKVLWDSKAEAQLLPAKVEITLDQSANSGLGRVTGFETPISPTRKGICSFRPHGVMAVLGPFNFPAHLPNGHIIPALAMGNTIVFKPSDKTPAIGQLLIEFLHEALSESNAPQGVVNLVQGGADVAAALSNHPDLDGILFTGSWPVGRRIMQANLDRPGRILALEMGGNNPAIIMPDADLKQAAIECVRSAFITTGQRCTCTRRVIVHESIAPRLVKAICTAASNLIIGHPASTHPVFMGPLIAKSARDHVLQVIGQLSRAGGELLVPPTLPDLPGWYITPSVMRVPRFVASADAETHAGADVEIFGPFLRVATFGTFDDALEQANSTQFGLASSIFTQDAATIERFLAQARAGCININAGTAGASSKLPFGGLGLSGNHRPAGAFSLDYCAMPIGSMVESGNGAVIPAGMNFDEAWVK
jgi:succinylglutamic semialdehyde dehydrogenase